MRKKSNTCSLWANSSSLRGLTSQAIRKANMNNLSMFILALTLFIYKTLSISKKYKTAEKIMLALVILQLISVLYQL